MSSTIQSSGNTTVDRLANIQLFGNIIPHSWYKAITLEDGKPDLVAIIILADILYWYRPKVILDEKTGEVIGYKKKFHADDLQRSYRQLMNMFNLSKKQIGRALQVLCDLNLIERYKKNDEYNGRKLNNVLYLKLNVDRLLEITDPPVNAPLVTSKEQDYLPERTTLLTSKEQDYLPEGTALPASKEQDCFLEGGTNTEITTKTVTKITSNTTTDISSEMGLQKKWTDDELYKANEELIKENIEYDTLMNSLNPTAQQRLTDILHLILDVIMTDKETIRIKRQEITVSVVRSVFKKLTRKEITHVLDQINQNANQIHDMKAYLLTVLFNAPNDVTNYFSKENTQDSS